MVDSLYRPLFSLIHNIFWIWNLNLPCFSKKLDKKNFKLIKNLPRFSKTRDRIQGFKQTSVKAQKHTKRIEIHRPQITTHKRLFSKSESSRTHFFKIHFGGLFPPPLRSWCQWFKKINWPVKTPRHEYMEVALLSFNFLGFLFATAKVRL